MNIINKKCEGWCIMCIIPQNIVNGPPAAGAARARHGRACVAASSIYYSIPVVAEY